MNWVPKRPTDGRTLDAVEGPVAPAGDPGIPATHTAMAFAVSRPGVTSAIVGPRAVGRPDGLLEGDGGALDGGALDRIDALVAPRSSP